MNIVRKELDNNNIPMLVGEAGIGKSSWLENLAKLMRTKCFTLACNQLADKADLTGARLVPITESIIDNDGNVTGERVVDYKQNFYPHAVISDAIAYAESHPRETPILFLDELNRTTPDVTSEALSIPTMRSIGTKSLPKNLKVVIAGNDKGNITSLDDASVSRFVLYHVEPDIGTFLSVNPDLNIFVKNVLTKHPETLLCKQGVMTESDEEDMPDESITIEDIIDEGEGLTQFTTPRTITNLSKWLNSFTNNELHNALCEITKVNGKEKSVLQEVIEAHVGETMFASLLIQEIGDNCMNTTIQTHNMNIAKPKCYDEMKSMKDMTSLNEYISKMTEEDRSGCMLYAVYEKEDNTIIIRALSAFLDTMIPEDYKSLVKMLLDEKADEGNTDILLDSNTKIAENLKLILNQ